jgi:hypothetical protein
LLLRPESRVAKVFENSILDPDISLEWQTLAVEWLREQIRISGIRIDRHALVYDLFRPSSFRHHASRTDCGLRQQSVR